jgi:hypothetical protein
MSKRPAFLPISARFDSESPQAKNQTPHAAMVIPARGDGHPRTRSWKLPRAATANSACFVPFSDVPKTDRLKGKMGFLLQNDN